MVIIRARRNAHARIPAKRTTTSLIGFFDRRGLACTAAVLVHDIARTRRQERPAAKRIAELTAAEFRTSEDAGPKGGVTSGALSVSSRGAIGTEIVAASTGVGFTPQLSGLEEAFGRAFASFWPSLGKDVKRPLGTGGSERSSAGTDRRAGLDNQSRETAYVGGTGNRSRGGGEGASEEGCDIRSARPTEELPEPSVCGPKGRRQDPSGGRFASIERVARVPPLQDGRNPCSPELARMGRFSREGGSEGGVFDCTDRQGAPPSAGLRMEESNVSVQSLAIRPGIGTIHIHQSVTPGDSRTSPIGHTVDSVPGRHPGDGSYSGGNTNSGSHFATPAVFSRVHSEPGKIRPSSASNSRVLGIRGLLSFDYPPFGQASSTEDTMLVPGGFGEAGAHGPPVSKLHRDAGGRMARRSSSPSPPSWTAAAPGWGKPAKIAVGSADQAQSRDAPGSSMVEQTPIRVEWPSCEGTGPIADHSVRCSNAWRRWRLGSRLRLTSYRRSLDQRRATMAHKRSRVVSRILRSAMLCPRGHQLPSGPGDGQHCRGTIHRQDGGPPEQEALPVDREVMAVVPRAQDHPRGTLSSGQSQHGGRLLVQTPPPRFSRMATQPDAVQAHPASFSAKPHRFVCDTNQRSTGAIRLVASRAVSCRYRRFCARLAQSRRLRLSTFLASESHDQSSASTEGSNPSLSDSIMEGSNLVSSTVGGGCSSSGPLAAVDRLTPRPAGPASSTSGEATTGTSRVAYLRTTYASAQFSPAVSELLLASWREGTGKHYNSIWRLWNSWCEPRKINPSCPPLKEVLSCLDTQFNEERAYHTVSGYRSALSSTLPPVDGVAVGAHPLVARLMKGAYNLRPPKPRYTSTWDVGKCSLFYRAYSEDGRLAQSVHIPPFLLA